MCFVALNMPQTVLNLVLNRIHQVANKQRNLPKEDQRTSHPWDFPSWNRTVRAGSRLPAPCRTSWPWSCKSFRPSPAARRPASRWLPRAGRRCTGRYISGLLWEPAERNATAVKMIRDWHHEALTRFIRVQKTCQQSRIKVSRDYRQEENNWTRNVIDLKAPATEELEWYLRDIKWPWTNFSKY